MEQTETCPAEPDSWRPFVLVHLDDGVHLDYAEPEGKFPGWRYTLMLVDEFFDAALTSIEE
jgi:hypothetical protein